MSLFSRPPNIEQLQTKKHILGLIKASQYQKSWLVRRDAARALGELQDLKATEALLALLSDAEKTVRLAAIPALGKLGDKRATPALIALLYDPNTDIQEAAVRSLGELGDQAAAEPLIDILEFKQNQSYQTCVVQRTAIQALGKLRSPLANEPLIDLLHLRDIRNEIKWIQRAAIEVLGQSEDTDAIPPLIELLKDTSASTHLQEYRSLGDIEADNALLKAIVLTLGRLSNGQIVGQILKLISEKDTAGTAIAVLHKVLETRTTEVSTENLRAIARLQEALPPHSASANGLSMPVEHGPIDCSPVKKLAQQELIRRGLKG